MLLSVIIPVYKQEKTILRDLSRIQKTLAKIRYEYEIILVFDGLHDNSNKKIKKIALKHIKKIIYMKNQGKAYAVRLGMKQATGNYVLFIDSGMEIHPNGISMLLEHMEWYDADIIVGSKRHPASVVHYPWNRKILSFGYYLFVKLLFGIEVHDTQAGIKIFKRKVLKKILPRLVEKKFAGDLEMLVVAKAYGYKRIFEAPIKLNYALSPVTSAAVLKSIWGIFIDTLAIFYRTYIIRYYQPKT